MRYIVAAIRPWNIQEYHETISKFPGDWKLISDPKDLTVEMLEKFQPRYIFFPHWGAKVSKEITDRFECVCFHSTDLPYGRGGSPIQNLIARGHHDTKVTALKMIQELDAGPIYFKKPLSLKGSAQEIFLRLSKTVSEMIHEMILNEPKSSPQNGEPTLFQRRTPQMSEIPSKINSLEELYNHIRMLDAEEYPKAFLQYGDLKLEFKKAKKTADGLSAEVTFSFVKENKHAHS